LGYAVEINGTIFVQIFIFLMILLWLSRSLFAPILRLFEERERRIEGAQEEARKLSALAHEKSQVFEIEYEKAKENARQTLSELKRSLEKELNEKIEEVKALAKEKIRAAERELLEQENQVRKQLLTDSINSISDEILKVVTKKSA
jgi:F-type H+-transporting ATPase subunit b